MCGLDMMPGMEPELTEAQKAELDRRIAEDDATSDDEGAAWDDVKAAALKRASEKRRNNLNGHSN